MVWEGLSEVVTFKMALEIRQIAMQRVGKWKGKALSREGNRGRGLGLGQGEKQGHLLFRDEGRMKPEPDPAECRSGW